MGIPVAAARPPIVKTTVASFAEEWHAEWRAAGWVLEDAAFVDARHLVLVFRVDLASPTIRTGVPRQLTKYSDKEEHAPYRAECLKLASLRHYREKHRDLEGTWDPMEGRSRVASTLEEFLERHDVRDVPPGAHLATVEATYETDDTSLIYCTSLARDIGSRHARWSIASRIRDVPKFALLLGAEFARQRDEGRFAAVTGSELLTAAIREGSGWHSVVRVHHGPVVYDDDAGEVLCATISDHASGLAAHFFKRTQFRDQQEYRFVLSAPGGRPIDEEFHLEISPELRSVFERR